MRYQASLGWSREHDKKFTVLCRILIWMKIPTSGEWRIFIRRIVLYCDKSLAKQIIPELVNACFILGGRGVFCKSVCVCVCVFMWATQRQCCNLAFICSPFSYKWCSPPQKYFKPVNKTQSSLAISLSTLFSQHMPVPINAVPHCCYPVLCILIYHIPHSLVSLSCLVSSVVFSHLGNQWTWYKCLLGKMVLWGPDSTGTGI